MPTIPADPHAGPAWPRRRLLLALPAACCLAWPAAATPGSAPPNAAVRRARAHLDALDALVQSAHIAQQDAEALQRALQALQASGRAAQDAEAPARTALQAWRDQALPALAPPDAQWRAATAAVQAAAGAHQAAARSLLTAAAAGRAAAMDRLDSAADQRRSAEATELAARHALDAALAAAAAAFDQLATRWQALTGPTAACGDGLRASAQRWAALQRRWQALGRSARAAGLAGLRLPTLAPAAPWALPGAWAAPAAPTAGALQAWRSADGRALQALQALWLQSDALAAVQQALADADCSGTACAAWRADAEALVADGARAQAALAAAQADQAGAASTLAAQPAAAGQQLQAVLARRDSLDTALVQAGGTALRSLRAAAAVGQAALAPLAAAREQAQAAWFAALQAQYGEAWMDALLEPGAGASMGEARAAPAPTGGSRLDLVLASHALHRLRARGDEPAGFGAYTYVLVGASVRPDTPGVHARLQRLLGEVHNLPVADQLDSVQRARANTFVVPVPADSRDDGDLVVHLPLAQSLLTHLPPALRLADATRRQLYAENGPFLITLPGRLAEARADWPLLFADLSKTPEVVVADVVRRYMADLIGSFNPASTDWSPPAGMRVAITLVRLVRGSGDVVQAVFGAPRR